jgi:hypothetical protein
MPLLINNMDVTANIGWYKYLVSIRNSSILFRCHFILYTSFCLQCNFVSKDSFTQNSMKIEINLLLSPSKLAILRQRFTCWNSYTELILKLKYPNIFHFCPSIIRMHVLTTATFEPTRCTFPELPHSRVGFCDPLNLNVGTVSLWKMASSEMLRRVAPVRTDVSEELIASIIRVTRIGDLWTLALTSYRRKLRRNTKYFLGSVRRLLVTANISSSPILVTLIIETLRSSETSVLTRTTRRNIP